MTNKRPLLSTNNFKTVKGEKLGYRTYILYMSAFRQNSKGINVCSHASAGCAASCLVGSGMGGMYTGVQQGRINRTEHFLRDRVGFLFQLKSEIERAIRLNKDKAIPVFRLNGTSDLPYEKYRVFEGGKNIFELFPDVQFYDYTKNWTRFDKVLPSNYYLTFSRSETNGEKAMELLARGINVAMVFDKLPETYQGYKVINADETDLRFLDERGTICGLKYKKMTGKGANNAEAFDSGFAIRTQPVIKKVVKKSPINLAA